MTQQPTTTKQTTNSPGGSTADDFARQATERSSGIVSEFVQFLNHNKKWWLLPIVLVLLAIGVLVVLGGTALAPFIYTLF
jgi:hypothetical protein